MPKRLILAMLRPVLAGLMLWGLAPLAGGEPPAAAGPAQTAPPPGFPYELVGRIGVGGGLESLVLAKGDIVFLASPGAVLDERYRVESLDAEALEVTQLSTGQRQRIFISELKRAPGTAVTSGKTNAPAATPPRDVWIRPTADGSPPFDLNNPPVGVRFRVDPSEWPAPSATRPTPTREREPPREIYVRPSPDGSLPPLVGVPPGVTVKVVPAEPAARR